MARLCAVLITHSRAPLYAHTVTVPHLVSSDVRGALWADVITDTSPFNNSELAIGVHIRGAIKAAFGAFPWCDVLSVVEDDVELSPHYFDALNAIGDTLVANNPSCFTCVNDVGFEYMGPWDPWSLRPVTHSIGLGFAISRQTYGDLLWGIRQWDNFVRATGDMVCYVPEVRLCTHHAARGSTHGVGSESRKLDRLQPRMPDEKSEPWKIQPVPTWPGRYVSSNLFVRAEVQECGLNAADAYVLRGTYFGLVEGGRRALCRTVPGHALPRETEVDYEWQLGSIGWSCTETCASHGLVCDDAGFLVQGRVFVQAYQALNICEEWGAETGHDQPAMAKLGGANVCLVPSLGSVSTCGGTHRKTRRLCPCSR
jgi:hypothetical protein